MLNLNRLQMFVTIVETGSFTNAAARLDVTKAMLSFNLRQLEGELGVSLLTRTTRSLAPAGAGVAVLPDWLVHDDVAAGRLVRPLPAYALPEQGAYAVYPNTRHLPARVGMFIAFLRGFVAGHSPRHD